MPRTERALSLLTSSKDDTALKATFDATGALTHVSSTTTDAPVGRDAARAGLASAAADAIDAGTRIVAPFTARAQADALQAKVDAKTAEAKLAPSTPDPLAVQVAKAELARLAAANRAATYPSTVVSILEIHQE